MSPYPRYNQLPQKFCKLGSDIIKEVQEIQSVVSVLYRGWQYVTDRKLHFLIDKTNESVAVYIIWEESSNNIFQGLDSIKLLFIWDQ